MKFIKLVIGICALILSVSMIAWSLRTGGLEKGTLRDWIASGEHTRITAVKILSGSDNNSEIISECVSGIAHMEGAQKWLVADAVRMCALGAGRSINNEQLTIDNDKKD